MLVGFKLVLIINYILFLVNKCIQMYGHVHAHTHASVHARPHARTHTMNSDKW